MSASQYNNPIGIYRKDLNLPRVHYPPLFDGLRNISFKHVMGSKFLTIAAMLFLVACFISLICIISPFWFKLVLSPQDGTFGGEAVKRELSINSGIFFLNEDQFDNLMDINEANNQQSVPRLLVFAQLLEITGLCSLVACLFGTAILALRKFAAVTAYFLLAFFATITGICLLMVFILAIILGLSSTCDPYEVSNCNYKDNLEWRAFPIYTQFYRVEDLVTPLIKLNWTAYIAIIPAILVIAASALLWIEACNTYKSMVDIRYRQLRTPRDPHEDDVDPKKHGAYVYQAPVQQGAMSYGMQPVVVQGGPYQYPQQPQSNVGFNVGFKDPGYKVGFGGEETKRAPSDSSPPHRRRSPPPRRRSPSPDDDSPGSSRRYSPPPYNGRKSPSAPRRRSPSPPPRRGGSPPPRRGGPPSVNSSMSEGPYISREIDL